MIVKLSRTLRIEATDGQNFTLQTLRARTTRGVEGVVWVSEGYYSRLELAAQAALRKEASERIARACELACSAAHAARCTEVVGEDWSPGVEPERVA
jgi:hypothetical protein